MTEQPPVVVYAYAKHGPEGDESEWVAVSEDGRVISTVTAPTEGDVGPSMLRPEGARLADYANALGTTDIDYRVITVDDLPTSVVQAFLLRSMRDRPSQ